MSGFVTDSGRILPISMETSGSPKRVALADLAQDHFHVGGHEMATLEEKVKEGIVTTSTESSLSSSEFLNYCFIFTIIIVNAL